MINKVLTKVFGTKHERDIKKLQPTVDAINALEPEIEALTNEELQGKTTEFRQRLQEGAELDDLLIEAFAVVREAAKRTLGMRHYDVQLVGGIVLHRGMIAEMKTGEGKTLMSTLPVYLNALTGRGVHLVTVNDYLASRDAEWMGIVYRFLGLTVGVIISDMPNDERREAYASDVTYGTNNEFGFDYLRDNMKFSLEQMVQRPHHFSIVDEVDSILIDEARTPLIISGPSEQSTEKYYSVDRIIPKLERGEEIEHDDGSKTQTGDFLVDEKAHTVALTDQGVASVERLLNIDNLYDMANMDFLHATNQGLRAHHLFKKDVDYLIKEKKVVIVDEFTGRMMPGRRWSDGLHQAVEAKEGVKIEKENQTLATITFQNYFRMYEKLSGMTGTADTEAKEFGEIYNLEVVVIPTNRPLIRDDRGDLIYRSAKEKWNAVVDDLREAHEKGQPVLVGTVSIENSEMLSRLLKRARVPHVVLNAKFHDREATIVAQAGRRGAITIATNMAGRGTDIVLGGNPEGLAHTEADPETEPEAYREALARFEVECKEEKQRVLDAGGLYILGTERHDSRRIDNQLRGRAGRQGDPGASRFYLSLEDDLMRIFVGNQWIQNYLMKHGMVEGEPLEHRMVSRAIEKAQSQVEARNFEVRKHLLDYDDVMNRQREAIYSLRSDILGGRTGRDYIEKISEDVIEYLIDTHCPEKTGPEDWALTELKTDFLGYFDINLAERNLELSSKTLEEIRTALSEEIEAKYSDKESRHGDELIRQTERVIALQTVDRSWKDHLLALDHLKEGIGLRGYGQRDPKQEYKKESFDLFQSMKERIEDTVIKAVFRAEPITEEEYRARRRKMAEAAARRVRMNFSAPSKTTEPSKKGPPIAIRKAQQKIGRNQPCPCGSGKKYKKCHGAA